MSEECRSGAGGSLLLDLRGFRSGEERIDRLYAPGMFPTGRSDEYAVARPVRLALTLRRNGERYRLRGELATAIDLACSRCLTRFEAPIALDVDVLYLPQRANSGEGEFEIEDGDLSTAFYQDEELDLGHLIREQLQLAVPMKPLCRVACRGLCTVCGVDLNVERCSCEQVWRDPRLEALRALRPAGGGRSERD